MLRDLTNCASSTRASSVAVDERSRYSTTTRHSGSSTAQSDNPAQRYIANQNCQWSSAPTLSEEVDVDATGVQVEVGPEPHGEAPIIIKMNNDTEPVRHTNSNWSFMPVTPAHHAPGERKQCTNQRRKHLLRPAVSGPDDVQGMLLRGTGELPSRAPPIVSSHPTAIPTSTPRRDTGMINSPRRTLEVPLAQPAVRISPTIPAGAPAVRMSRGNPVCRKKRFRPPEQQQILAMQVPVPVRERDFAAGNSAGIWQIPAI
ncbi:hypothetical protein BDV93DRAFT_513855 [Ceratobasidium sp. AG-I]|nr:hypothetical protein BDV93DRAFT_513855 [Ceratobasidium sp. AG-I]